ncbi:N-dimethylarginine dimethylaminohydrolase [Streptomyces sp. SAI-144]|uniref:dimethylargininase n=1 Tax=Streptomyces sp. SAI-144 TaxID=2940544 RepID=UPI002476683C|nr:dimethylargininase [Streptomyces sp. SAI-144]MDH6439241.1 N-dimethylarginine dimethylaminohydrolase [Streptomyces sp. SAI-144]
MSRTATGQSPASGGVVRPRRYLMCRPTHFTVNYSINPWMDPVVPTSTETGLAQWKQLHDLLVELGHDVELMPPDPGLPDMVFAANGAVVVDGKALVARFRHAQRTGESAAYAQWFRAHGWTEIQQATRINEGEGDFLLAGELLLAGSGFRSETAAWAEAAEFLGRPVLGLTLVDPCFYHLDTALAVLDDEQIMYYPGAFSSQSREALAERFPEAVLASEQDARVFGLNAVSDGRHVVLAQAARRLAGQLRERGFEPIGVDLSELLKAGGGVKCCLLELRPAELSPPARGADG